MQCGPRRLSCRPIPFWYSILLLKRAMRKICERCSSLILRCAGLSLLRREDASQFMPPACYPSGGDVRGNCAECNAIAARTQDRQHIRQARQLTNDREPGRTFSESPSPGIVGSQGRIRKEEGELFQYSACLARYQAVPAARSGEIGILS